MENLDDELPTDAKGWQQFFYERFGDRDWDSYNLNQEYLLKRMIGFALYGSPTELGDNNNEVGYGKKANEHIQSIYELIWKNHFTADSNEILLRIIFISCELRDKKKPLICRPVFVVKKCSPITTGAEKDTFILYDSCNIFIDESARVYHSWQLFLKNNKLPKCIMFCPINGQYRGEIIGEVKEKAEDGEVQVMLEVRDSPACSLTKKFLLGSDRAKTAVSIGSTATFVVAAIPGIFVAPALIAAAAVGGLAVGAYTVGRSVANLRDRKKHDQTIALSDPEARSSWIDAGVGVLSGATSATGLIATAASSSANISQAAAQAAYNALNVASMVGTTTSFIFSGYNIYEKLKNNEIPNSLDIFQFSSSVLFFHKSVAGFKTAKTIISETRSSTLKEYGDTLRSNRHRKLFKKAQLEAQSTDVAHSGYQEIISGIQDIDDPNNFFSGLAKINKKLKRSGERYFITADDCIKINKAYIIDEAEISIIDDKKDQVPLKAIEKSSETHLDLETKQLITDSIFAVKYTFMIKTVYMLMENEKDNILETTKEFFDNLKDLESLTILLKNYSDENVKDIIKILLKFMNNIPQVVIEMFLKLYPFVSILVGALQFLLKYLENNSQEVGVSFENILWTFFNHDDTINEDFVLQLFNRFENWVDERFGEMFRSKNKPNLPRKPKLRKVCTDCQGFYFDFIE